MAQGIVRSILRRLSTPLLQVGDLAFDCEVAAEVGGETQFTEARVAAGSDYSDHAYDQARIFVLEGAVSGLGQLQNFGRPGFSGVGALVDAGLSALESITGLDFSSRVLDFEARLEAVRLRHDELEVISKMVGRARCVLLSWRRSAQGEEGDMGRYRLTLKEVQEAGLSIADATAEALALNGSGGAVVPGGGGPSSTTPGTANVVP